jgi:8-oxo-dGTP diphosphatase
MPRRSSARRPAFLPEDRAFLAAYRPADFPRPSVTVDVVALTIVGERLRVLLVKRGAPPYRGRWALPGGFVRVSDDAGDRGESLDEAVARELHEETGLTRRQVYLQQLGAFGDPDRDPRMRVITVAYYALVRPDLVPRVLAGGDASEAAWLEPSRKVDLAFDHAAIIEAARKRIRERIETTGIAESLVPTQFTIPELRTAYAIVKGEDQDPGNFRRRFQTMLEAGLVERAPGMRATSSKPAAVYRFRTRSTG